MSGGTDSSVAAMLLLDAGYEVTGITIQNIWTTHESFAQDLAFRTLLTTSETDSKNTS